MGEGHDTRPSLTTGEIEDKPIVSNYLPQLDIGDSVDLNISGDTEAEIPKGFGASPASSPSDYGGLVSEKICDLK